MFAKVQKGFCKSEGCAAVDHQASAACASKSGSQTSHQPEQSSKVDNIICLVQTNQHAHATGQQHETGALKLNTQNFIPSRSTALQQLHPYRRQFGALRRNQRVSRQNVRKKQPKPYIRSQLGQLHCHKQCICNSMPSITTDAAEAEVPGSSSKQRTARPVCQQDQIWLQSITATVHSLLGS